MNNWKSFLGVTGLILFVAMIGVAQQHHAGKPAIYPDSENTPGGTNPDVKQGNIQDNICSKHWSGTNPFTHKKTTGTDVVRPPQSVTDAIKKERMTAYGFSDSKSDYELDHLISLQNGGCSACVENLWPEAYGDARHHKTETTRASWDKAHPTSTAVLPGALQKDQVENFVHDEICFGIPNAKFSTAKKNPPTRSITLSRGQEILANDWYMCYLKMVHHMACA